MNSYNPKIRRRGTARLHNVAAALFALLCTFFGKAALANKIKWRFIGAALACLLAAASPPLLAVDDSGTDDNLFEIGQNEDTLEDEDTVFGNGPHKNEVDPRANILGCNIPDIFPGAVDPTCLKPAGAGSNLIVTPGHGPDWDDLFTGILNTDVDSTDTARVFVVPTAKDIVHPSGAPPLLTPGANGIPDYEDYGGSSALATFVGDQIAAQTLNDTTTTVAGGSDSNNDLPVTYEWGTDSIPIKDDITNLIGYAVNNPANNHLILYFGIERLNVDGDSHLDIELNQNKIGLDEDPPCDKDHCFFVGARKTNDALVSIDFTNGGDLGSLEVRRWIEDNDPNTTGGEGAWSAPVVTLTGEGCNPANGFPTADVVCIFNNNANINGGRWPNFVKSTAPVAGDTFANGYSGGVIPRNAFSEFGMDLTAILGSTPCIASGVAKTRSSQSFTAQLKDFAAIGFELCGIDVAKTGDTLSKVGDSVDYTIIVENSGTITLYKQSITDDLLGNFTTQGSNQYETSNTCGDSLAAGAECTIHATRTVQAGDPDPLPNTVTAIYNSQSDLLGATVENSDDHAVPLFQPSVEIVKEGDTLSKVGDEVTYNFVITNTSDAGSGSNAPDLELASIGDTVLGDLSAQATAAGCATLATGASCSFDVNRTVLAGDPDPLNNTVTVLYHPAGFPNDVSASDGHSVDLFQPAVNIEKTGDTLSKIGDSVTYHFAITNTGNGPDLNLASISDTILGNLSAQATAAGCATLATGASCSFDVDRTVLAEDPDPLNNTVTVLYHPAGFPNDVSDSDDHSVNLFQPAITLDKTGDALSKVGDDVNYTITLTNTSSADTPALTCTITDVLLGIDKPVNLASGANDVTNTSYTVLGTDPDPLINTADVTCTVDGFGNVLTASDGHSVNLFQPAITLDKTGDGLSKVGDDVNYTITLTNTSSADTPDLTCTITDVLLGIDKPVNLAAGANDVTNTSYTVLGTDPDPLVNTAGVTCTVDGFGNVLTASDGHSVNLFQPAIALDKTGDELSKVGDDVNYTITLSNNSSADTPALTCTITDVLLGIDKPVNLASGANDVTNTSYTVLGTDPDPLVNTAGVTCTVDGFGNVLTASDGHSVNLFQPAIALDKTGDGLSKVGDDVNYTITLTNTSSADTPDLTCTITDVLLGIDKPVNLASGFNDVTNTSYTVLGTDPDPLVNTADVTCTVDGFGNVLTASDGHSVDLFQPSISVAKQCDSEPVVAGNPASFTVTITNTSSAGTPNLVLANSTETLDGSCNNLALGGSCQTTIVVPTTGSDAFIGVSNSVEVHYNPLGFPNDIAGSASDTCDVVAPDNATIIIQKQTTGGTGEFGYELVSADGLPPGGPFNLNTATQGNPTDPAVGTFAVPIATINQIREFTVDETVLALGSTFVDLVCTDPTGDTTIGAGVAGLSKGTIHVGSGETVSCLYTNTFPNEGCTPGFWKNHTSVWDQPSDSTSLALANAAAGLGYGGDGTTSALFRDTFGLTAAQMTAVNLNANLTLGQAVNLNGGDFRKLARHGVSGALSAASGVNYTFSTQAVLTMVHDAIVNLAAEPTATNLANANNQSEQNCPTF